VGRRKQNNSLCEKGGAEMNKKTATVLSMPHYVSIKNIPIFSQLNEIELNTVIEVLKPLYAKEEDTIFREGDTGENMFILLSGALSAFGAQSDGTQRWLFDIKPGDFFGEMSIIAHEPRSATISAKTDAVVMMLNIADFFKIIKERPVIGYKILRVIGTVQNQWLDQSSKTYSDLIRWGEKARRRAITDEMTGLYNRRFLEDSIKERLNKSYVNYRIMTLLMMDLDKIHGINERYGTKAGDLIIISSANIIRANLRHGDIPARLSGDEFAILLPDTDIKDAAVLAEKIRESIENGQVEVPSAAGADDHVLISTRTSIGISTAPAHANTTEKFVETADIALRKAKEMGRNRVEIFG
jgi:diguanylate cyclase (GGDEF)-like protein